MPTIKIKRVYKAAEAADGFRMLVDRLWPRGLKKEAAQVDVWMKEVAPSAELRKWFNHEPEKWEAFRKKYKAELQRSEAVRALLQHVKKHKIVTLLYAARDEEHNDAVVLQQFLNDTL